MIDLLKVKIYSKCMQIFMWKSNCPLSPLWSNFVPHLFAKLFQFSHTFEHATASVRYKSGLWQGPSKSVCFRSLFWFLNPTVLGHNLTFSFRIFWLNRIYGSISYVKWSRSWSSKALDHHITTTALDCWYALIVECCVSYTPDVTGCMSSKKSYFWLPSPRNKK